MESERHSVSLRDRRLGVRSYTIYGLGTHFRVRVLPPEPAKPVSTSHVQLEKTLSNLPGLSGLEARLCARRVWLFCDLSGILRASLWSPNCNFQNANPETRFESGFTVVLERTRFGKPSVGLGLGATRAACHERSSQFRHCQGDKRSPLLDQTIRKGRQATRPACAGLTPTTLRRGGRR
jgi:hypothetical protein